MRWGGWAQTYRERVPVSPTAGMDVTQQREPGGLSALLMGDTASSASLSFPVSVVRCSSFCGVAGPVRSWSLSPENVPVPASVLEQLPF